jgi:hypothetical protein
MINLRYFILEEKKEKSETVKLEEQTRVHGRNLNIPLLSLLELGKNIDPDETSTNLLHLASTRELDRLWRLTSTSIFRPNISLSLLMSFSRLM